MSADHSTDGSAGTVVIVCARNEADRIGATLAALREALPGAHLVVADDASEDGTGEVALSSGAELIRRGRSHGKGGNATAAAEAVLGTEQFVGRPFVKGSDPVVMFCDGDLGESAGELVPLVRAVEAGECDLAVAAFSRRVGGGFGVALGFAHWAIKRLCGFDATAPISGQRAMTAATLRDVVPFSAGYGMEIGMTVDAVRAGHRLREYELELSHRATGRTLAGFLHRARQLKDFTRVYLRKRRG